MSWTRLDDGFWGHPKIEAAGNAATGLFARSLSYCGAYSTGGFVPASWAQRIGTPAEVKALVRVGLWEKVAAGDVREVTGRRDSGGRSLPDAVVTMPAEGYFIPDFLHFNWTKSEVENLRLKRREAGRVGGYAKAGATAHAKAGATADELAGAEASARHAPTRPVPTRPVPTERVTTPPTSQASTVDVARETSGLAGRGDDLDFERVGIGVGAELERLRAATVAADVLRAGGAS